jgi:serine dehydrogenase proteinase
MTADTNHAADSPSDSDDKPEDVLGQALPTPTKTPLYQAINALRYQRQAVITNIQERIRRRLICYVAGNEAPVDRDDTVGFVDLLHNVPGQCDVDLLLHTGGGDIDAAEKLISMVRTKVGTATLRVVVPDYAKSAGTLMALGADTIVMSDTSELGPIDPQIILADGNGNRIRHSVQSYLDAYDTHSATLKKDPGNVPAQIMLSKLDPATVKLFEAVRNRARGFAEDQLKKGMFRDGKGNWSQAASELLDTKRWQSHAQMISWQDAKDPKIGLQVEYLEPSSEDWQNYWQLYCLQRLAVGDNQKLFESDYASLVVDSSST